MNDAATPAPKAAAWTGVGAGKEPSWRCWNALSRNWWGGYTLITAHDLDADSEPAAGDRVAAWLPNGLEAIVVMLGAASVGAICMRAVAVDHLDLRSKRNFIAIYLEHRLTFHNPAAECVLCLEPDDEDCVSRIAGRAGSLALQLLE